MYLHECIFHIPQGKNNHWRLMQNFVLEQPRKCDSKFCQDYPNCVYINKHFFLTFLLFPTSSYYVIVYESGLPAEKQYRNKNGLLTDKIHRYIAIEHLLYYLDHILFVIIYIIRIICSNTNYNIIKNKRNGF